MSAPRQRPQKYPLSRCRPSTKWWRCGVFGRWRLTCAGVSGVLYKLYRSRDSSRVGAFLALWRPQKSPPRGRADGASEQRRMRTAQGRKPAGSIRRTWLPRAVNSRPWSLCTTTRPPDFTRITRARTQPRAADSRTFTTSPGCRSNSMSGTKRLQEGDIERAVEDLNPRHQVLETCVLPTELTAQGRCPPIREGSEVSRISRQADTERNGLMN